MADITLSTKKPFPTAVGYGANWSFLTNYTVRKVTNLNNSGSGSLREAVGISNSIVIFEVAGYINTTTTINVANNVHIAGQTAFRNGGQGITVRRDPNGNNSGPLFLAGNNISIRHFRMRVGKRVDGDCCGDAWNMAGSSNFIADHMSASYSSDEMWETTGSANVTIQNTISSEPLSETGTAGGKTFQGGAKNMSLYRNLIVNSAQRNPALFATGGVTGNHPFEYINNVGSNLGSFGLTFNSNNEGGYPSANIIGNYWYRPTGSSNQRKWVMLDLANANSRYYLSNDNFDSLHRPTVGGDVWNQITTDADAGFANNFSSAAAKTAQNLSVLSTPIVNSGIPLVDGFNIWANIKPTVGCYKHRDSADTRVVGHVDNANAPDWAANYPNLTTEFGVDYSALSGMTSVPTDSNGDGIPDAFAATHGITSATQIKSVYNFGTYTVTNTAGYTALEIYLASLAGDLDELSGEVPAEVTVPNLELTELTAFPGAKGYGKFTTGGRGGIIYHVTNLNDSGFGSLRYGLEQLNQRRTIVFDVGGDIVMSNASINTGINVPVSNTNINIAGDVTIAGQTAPSPGIALKENGIRFADDNLVLRYFTIRSSDNGAPINQDSPGGLTFRNYNTGKTWNGTIADHLTISHAGNENLAMGGDSPNYPMLNTTLSNCMIGVHNGDGAILSFYNTPNMSIIQNYIHHSERRNPLMSGSLGTALGQPVEFINNIIYGGEGGPEGDRTVTLDFLYNIFRSTVNMATLYYPFSIVENQKNNIPAGAGDYHYKGNLIDGLVRKLNDQGQGNSGDYSPELLQHGQTTTRVATNSLYNDYLTDHNAIKEEVFSHVGNSLYRDTYDQQKIDDYTTNSGTYSLAGKPTKATTFRPNNFYVSNPDIPEAFVQAHGITSNTQVITNWDFGTYTVTNTAGFPALDMYFAYVAGDLDKLAGETAIIGEPPVIVPPVLTSLLYKKNQTTLFINS